MRDLAARDRNLTAITATGPGEPGDGRTRLNETRPTFPNDDVGFVAERTERPGGAANRRPADTRELPRG
jgi:hypothetical protein